MSPCDLSYQNLFIIKLSKKLVTEKLNMNYNYPERTDIFTQGVSIKQRLQKWDTYRIAKRNIYFQNTTINFIQRKYMGKKRVIEIVTKKKN